jgi:hypothetical protein
LGVLNEKRSKIEKSRRKNMMEMMMSNGKRIDGLRDFSYLKNSSNTLDYL